MKRVLLTGGTGFIGRQTVDPLLARGFDVHLAVLPSEVAATTSPAGTTIHACDLFDPDGVRKVMRAVCPSHLLHLAWYVVHGQFWTSPENHRWVQVSLDLLRSFAQGGGRRAVMAGTCAEYDWSQGTCRENITPLAPRSLYGQCKMAIHQSAEEFAQGAAVSLAWGRIFFLYGPGEASARLVPSIILPLLAGQRATCRQGSHVRDLLHVSDVAAAFVALLDSDVRGAVNIASGCPASLGQVAETIARILEKSRMLDVQEAQPLPDNPIAITADTRRLNEEVGWRSALSLEQGLRQTIDWWKGQ